MFANVREVCVDRSIDIRSFEDFELEASDDDDGLSIYNIESLSAYSVFLTLPSLCTFRIQNFDTVNPAALIAIALAPQSWAVENVHLTNCDVITGVFLRAVLQRIQALKIFTFSLK